MPDANVVRVASPSDVIELMNLGERNRAVSATAMNDRSSRSHRSEYLVPDSYLISRCTYANISDNYAFICDMNGFCWQLSNHSCSRKKYGIWYCA